MPRAETLFKAEELQRARTEWERRVGECPSEQRGHLILQYANPVLNQYRLKQPA